MPQQHFGKAYGGSAPENYERYFVPAIGAPWQLTSSKSPRFVRVSVCWMLPAGPVSWRARFTAGRRHRDRRWIGRQSRYAGGCALSNAAW
jgi:hypothetical protein